MSNSRVFIDPTTRQVMVDGKPADMASMSHQERLDVAAALYERQEHMLAGVASSIADREQARADFDAMPVIEQYADMGRGVLETAVVLGKASTDGLDKEFFGGTPVIKSLYGLFEAHSAAQMRDHPAGIAKSVEASLDAATGIPGSDRYVAAGKALLAGEEGVRGSTADGGGFTVTSSGLKVLGAAAEWAEESKIAKGFDEASITVDLAKALHETYEGFETGRAKGESVEFFDRQAEAQRDHLKEVASQYGEAALQWSAPPAQPGDTTAPPMDPSLGFEPPAPEEGLDSPDQPTDGWSLNGDTAVEEPFGADSTSDGLDQPEQPLDPWSPSAETTDLGYDRASNLDSPDLAPSDLGDRSDPSAPDDRSDFAPTGETPDFSAPDDGAPSWSSSTEVPNGFSFDSSDFPPSASEYATQDQSGDESGLSSPEPPTYEQVQADDAGGAPAYEPAYQPAYDPDPPPMAVEPTPVFEPAPASEPELSSPPPPSASDYVTLAAAGSFSVLPGGDSGGGGGDSGGGGGGGDSGGGGGGGE